MNYRKSKDNLLGKIILLSLALALGACCNLNNIANDIEKKAPSIPSIVKGKSGISGRIISKKTGEPLKNLLIRLADVYRRGAEGAFVLDDAQSPGGYSDKQGRFNILNINPGEYVIVLGMAQTEYEIIGQPSGQAKVWQMIADKILQAGDIATNLE
jgi:hypothetical protein